MEAADPYASLFCLIYQLFLFLHVISPRMDMNISLGPEGGSEDSPQQWSNFTIWASVIILLGFPGGSTCQWRRHKFDPPGQEDLLKKEMETCSSILAWKIPWKRSLAGYSPWGLKRVGHNWVTKQQQIVLLQEGNYLRDFVRGVPSTHCQWPSTTWSVSPI